MAFQKIDMHNSSEDKETLVYKTILSPSTEVDEVSYDGAKKVACDDVQISVFLTGPIAVKPVLTQILFCSSK